MHLGRNCKVAADIDRFVCFELMFSIVLILFYEHRRSPIFSPSLKTTNVTLNECGKTINGERSIDSASELWIVEAVRLFSKEPAVGNYRRYYSPMRAKTD